MPSPRMPRHVATTATAARSTIVLTLGAALTLTAPGSMAAGYLPDESAPHEATWLQWPHHHEYGQRFRRRVEATWVAMTAALVPSERVRIIAYDRREQRRIEGLLREASVALEQVDFYIAPTNDSWVRDNGPIFTFEDASDELRITDWGFNGWGHDAPFRLDDEIPLTLAKALDLPRVDLSGVVLEGGAVEVDGRGTLMATRSSILGADRNPGLSEGDVEAALGEAFGVHHFLWLDGRAGGQEDITDTHIDGLARFADPHTIVTMSAQDLVYFGLSEQDAERLLAAEDARGDAYRIVQLPLTANEVITDYGYALGFKGSYVNFYTANEVVLMPTYDDPMDSVAKEILQAVYAERRVVGIDARNLYRHGGMIHCVTQQQPARR